MEIRSVFPGAENKFLTRPAPGRATKRGGRSADFLESGGISLILRVCPSIGDHGPPPGCLWSAAPGDPSPHTVQFPSDRISEEMMHAWHRCCPNVSHLVALPPPAATATFDLMILDPALAELLVPAGALIKASPDRYDAFRRLPVRLVLPGRRRASMHVQLELLPWSEHRCDLTINCTANSRLPLGSGPACYRAAAESALGVLGRLMEAGTVRPNRRVPAGGAHAAPTMSGQQIPGSAVLTAQPGPLGRRSTLRGER